MPYYLVQDSLVKESIKALVDNPENRLEAVRPALEELGVTIREDFLAFGTTMRSSSWRRPTTCGRRRSLWPSRQGEGSKTTRPRRS